MASKQDINPATGKAYAINPATGLWDDNYFANTVEPSLKGTETTMANNNYSSPIPLSSGQMPSKADINPATGKAYAINPQTGVWDDNYWANTVEPSLKAQYSTDKSSGISFNQPTIDLPKLYESMYASSGISEIEKGLSAKNEAYNAQVAKIKDNPYLSEATMTGRIKKLEEKFSADAQSIQNQIAMKKADIETKLNLETKQFDIENEQVKLAWDQFNSLLSSGALDNASGEDIAQLTRATGISSSMIQSAIGVSKAKNAPKVNTQVIQVDDGTNISAVVINTDTGEVINRQVIGASKPSGGSSDYKIGSTAYNATAIGDMSRSIASFANSYGHVSPADWKKLLQEWMNAGLTREEFIKNFGHFADPNRGDFDTAYGFEKPY